MESTHSPPPPALRIVVVLLALSLGGLMGRSAALDLRASRAATRSVPTVPAVPVAGRSRLGSIDPDAHAVVEAGALRSDAGTPQVERGGASAGATTARLPPPDLPTRGIPGAAARGDLPALRAALAEGRSLELRDSAGRSLFAIAAHAGQLPVLQWLWRHGGAPPPAQAALHTVTHDGRTPLMLAAGDGFDDVVAWLLGHGAKLRPRDRGGRTALHHAIRSGEAAVVGRVLDAGAEVDARTERSITPLMQSVLRGDGEVLEALIAHGAALELQDKSGATALSLAADRPFISGVQRLLRAGSRVDAPNFAGLTPLGYALLRRRGLRGLERRRYADAAAALASAGADFSLLHRPALLPTLDRRAFDTLAARHGAGPLPHAPIASKPEHLVTRRGAAATRLFRHMRRRRSRRFEKHQDQRLLLSINGAWRVGNVLQKVRVSGLNPRAGQRVTLAGDAAGDWNFHVDDTLLFEAGDGRRAKVATHVGVLHELKIMGRKVPRRGTRRFEFGADAIDLTDVFAAGDIVDIHVLDWGGVASVSEVYLRVVGPRAADTLGRAELEVLR